MRIPFKSVPVVAERGGFTAFNIGDVRSHVAEVSLLKLLFHPKYFSIAMAIAAVCAVVVLFATRRPSASGIVEIVVAVGAFLLAWIVSYSFAHGQAMENQARADRGVDAKFPLRVVTEKRWPAFEADLRKRGF